MTEYDESISGESYFKELLTKIFYQAFMIEDDAESSYRKDRNLDSIFEYIDNMYADEIYEINNSCTQDKLEDNYDIYATFTPEYFEEEYC